MANFVTFLLVLYFAHVQSDVREDLYDIYKHVALEARAYQQKLVTPDNVTYYLFTKENPDQYMKIDSENLSAIAKRGNKLVFFIHGWTDSREIGWYEDLKNAFLYTYPDYSVIQVDWSGPANQSYLISSVNTHDVAGIIADFLVKLSRNYSVELDDILLVGHSLGGQITGFVGKNVFQLTGKKLPRIIALDPAGPLFNLRPDDNRLNKNDAEIVHVIHTDGGTFGFEYACGTIDFFPNGGSTQLGCNSTNILDLTNLSVSDAAFCDHHRAYEYFPEAILNPKGFVGKKCPDWDAYKENKCEKEVEVAMGDIKTKATGKFYLETNEDKPYAKEATNDTELSKILQILKN